MPLTDTPDTTEDSAMSSPRLLAEGSALAVRTDRLTPIQRWPKDPSPSSGKIICLTLYPRTTVETTINSQGQTYYRPTTVLVWQPRADGTHP